VYYQDAVAAPPFSFAPEAVVADHPVDVAILVPATFDEVDWHPEALVENLDPERILLGHWEDFFAPMGPPSHSVLLQDIDYFEERLARVFEGEVFRPEVGTHFVLGPGG
jgi:hypothetical protein